MEEAEKELATLQDANMRKVYDDRLRELKLNVERISRTEQQLRGEESRLRRGISDRRGKDGRDRSTVDRVGACN